MEKKMNLQKLLTKLGAVIVLLTFVASSAFAQTYVSNTNGNDITGTGTALSPYKTIAVGITNTSEGGTVVIDADTYNEANVSITKSITLVSQAFNALTTVTITNGVTVNGSGKTVNIGRTADGSLGFNLGSTATALTLTAGTLNITQANVTIASGGRITRSGGTINEGPTTTNVNVYYSGATAITAGPELPTSLGTGSLNISMGAAATLVTVGGNLALSSGQIVVVQGSATFGGTVSVTSDAPNAATVDNQGAGTVTFDLAVTGAEVTAGGATPGTIIQNGAGTVTLTGGVSGTGFTFGLTNGAGTINVGPGTYAGAIANNTNLGTLNLLSSVTFSNNAVSNGNAGAVIKLNGFQLTLSGAAATLTNTGNLISSTASTVGSGNLNISGVVTTTGTGQLPNLTIAPSGKLTLGAATSVYGDVTLNSAVAGAITDGGFVLSVYGSTFNRTDNTPLNYTATGTLTFASATAQAFNPGGSLVLNHLTINKGSGAVLTLGASVEVAGNLTITAGSLNVGNYNLNLTGASTFDNSGNAYSTTGVGYVVFGGASGIVTGTGTFGNILVNLSNAANTVATTSSIAFSGILYINQGQFHVANGHTVTFNNTLLANPTIKINTTAANTAGLTNVTAGGTGTLAFSTNVNLEYFGTGAYNVNTLTLGANTAGLEWTVQPLKLNNVTISSSNTVTGAAAASTIAGTLSVAAGATLAQGAFVYTLSGDAKTHSILGTVSGGSLTVTGSGSAVNGTTSTTAGNTATVNNLLFEPAANGATFTSTNLKVVSGDITLLGTSTKTGATSTVSLNPTTATLTGNLAVGNGTVGPSASVTIAGTTTSVFGGNLALTNGSLTLTRGGNSTVIGGTVTLTAGSLLLGSNVAVTGQTTQAAGNLDAGGFKFTQNGSAADPDYNRTGAGTFTNGTLSLVSTAAAITVTPGATFTVPNLESVGTANGVTIGADMGVTNSLLIDNAGTFAQTGVLTVSGNTATVTGDAGAFTGAMTLSGADASLTIGQNYAIPTLVINSAGTVALHSDDEDASPTARTLTVGTAFTNTAGIFSTGINTVSVATAFTFTAGAITQSTGYLNINVGVPSLGTGFTVDNLAVLGAFDVSAAKEKFTVNKNLKLTAGALTTFADGDLTLGDGATITRTAGSLAKLPTFGATTNLVYDGGAGIAAAKEQPSTVTNYTVTGAATNVTLAANFTFTGTLSLEGIVTTVVGPPSINITAADGATLELKNNGTVVLPTAQDIVRLGALNIIYNGAALTSTKELGAITSGAHPVTTGNVTVKTTVALVANTTFAGTLSFDNAADITTTGFTINLQGNVAQTHATAGFFAGTGSVWFTGANNTTLTLTQNEALPGFAAFGINKTNDTNSVTLMGGKNLDFATTPLNITLTKGIFDTDANSVIILKQNKASNQPTQGFARTSGVITGNVRKFIDATDLVAISLIEYPTGSPSGEYRPAKFFFKTAPQSSINLTVDHQIGSPNGGNGLPLNTGSVVITNYAPFFWFIKSDISLAPSYKFDLELQAEGYSDYVLDGIQNVRMIRRDSGNVANQWRLQGSDSNYDNSTIAANWPLVKVIDATGGVTSTGAIFSYSQSDKAPAFTSAGAQTVTEGVELTFNVSADDPDVGQTATLAVVSKPAGSEVTIDGQMATFTWTPAFTDSGAHKLILSATDGNSTAYDTTSITVTNVNQAPVFTAELPDTQAVAEGVEFTHTYVVTDEADNTALYYTILTGPAGATLDISTGAFVWTPAFETNGTFETLTVVVFDADSAASDTTTSVLRITKTNRAPVISQINTLSIDEGATGTVTYTATDPDSADALTFSLSNTAGDTTNYGASITTAGVFSWSPGYTQAGTYNFIVTVTDNGAPNLSDSDTLVVTVVNQNAAPEFTSVLENQTIVFGGTITATYQATDLDGDALTYSFNGESPEGATLNATTGEFSWTPVANQTAIYLIKIKVSDGTAEATTQAEITVTGVVGVDDVAALPTEFTLEQNYPNPFNPTTVIKFGLPEQSNVTLKVYNLLGQEVATLLNTVKAAGWHEVNFNAASLSTGLYIYRIEAKDFVSIKKMMLVK